MGLNGSDFIRKMHNSYQKNHKFRIFEDRLSVKPICNTLFCFHNPAALLFLQKHIFFNQAPSPLNFVIIRKINLHNIYLNFGLRAHAKREL